MDKLTDYIMDLVHVWQVILITLGTAVVLGMIYMILVRCFAGVIIWFSILGIMAILGAGGYWVYLYRTHYETTDNNYKYVQYGAYTLWGIDGVFLILVLCCFSRIRLAVAIMKVTGSFILNTPQILFLPLIFIIISLAWIAAWTFTAVYLFSVGNIEPRPDPLAFMTTVAWTKQTRYIFLYHLFGGLWVNAFIIGCC